MADKDVRLKMLIQAVDKAGTKIDSVTQKLRNQQGQINRLNQSGKKLGSEGSQAVSKFGSAIKGLLGPLAAIASFAGFAMLTKQMISMGSEFEKTMAIVGGVMRATTSEFEALEAQAMKMGETTEWTANQAAQALQFLGMAGFEASEAMAALPGTLDLATAGNLDLGRAADITTNALTAMGLPVEELGRVNDRFIATITRTNTNMEMMAESFKYAAPSARAFGYDIEQLDALIGLLGNSGIQGSMAGTQLAFAFTKVNKVFEKLGMDGEGKNLVDALEAINEAGWNTNEILEVFGQRGGRAVLVLKDQVDEYKELHGEIKASNGENKKLADTMRNTTIGAFKELTSAIQGVAISGFKEFAEGLTENIKELTKWVRENKDELLDMISALADCGQALFKFSKFVMDYGVKPLGEFARDLKNTAAGLGLVAAGVIDLSDTADAAKLDKIIDSIDDKKFGSLNLEIIRLNTQLRNLQKERERLELRDYMFTGDITRARELTDVEIPAIESRLARLTSTKRKMEIQVALKKGDKDLTYADSWLTKEDSDAVAARVEETNRKIDEKAVKGSFILAAKIKQIQNEINEDKVGQLKEQRDKEIDEFVKSELAIRDSKGKLSKQSEEYVGLIRKKYAKQISDELLKVEKESAEDRTKVLEAEADLANTLADQKLEEYERMYDNRELSIGEFYDKARAVTEEKIKQEIELIRRKIAEANSEPEKQALEIQLKIAQAEGEGELAGMDADRQKALQEQASQYDSRDNALLQRRRDMMAQELYITQEQADAELEILTNKQNEEYKLWEKHGATEAQLNDLLLVQDQEYAAKRVQVDQDMWNSKLQLASDMAGMVGDAFSDLYKASGEEMKEFFYLDKAAKIAQAMINAHMMASNAMTFYSSTNPYLAAAMGALHYAMGAARVAAIASQSLAEGGQVQGRSPHSKADNIPINATAKEWVHPVSAVDYYGASVMAAIQKKAIPREIFQGLQLPVRVPHYGRRYAEGGQVVGSGTSATTGKPELQTNIVNVVDPNMFEQYVASTSGQRAIINVIRRHAYEVNNALASEM